eukprot:832380_1
MAPTNQGTLLLANKCDEMNERMRDVTSTRDETLCDGFIRRLHGDDLCPPRAIRDLCVRYYGTQKSKEKRFKVLYFASQTYANILGNRNLLQKQKRRQKEMNLAAEYHMMCVSCRNSFV